jgi:cation transport ATPase
LANTTRFIVTGEQKIHCEGCEQHRELAGSSYRLAFTDVVPALVFNGVGVLAAISGLVTPVWATLTMAASRSLRLANSFTGGLLPKGSERGTPAT